jgi:hypothetical protein
LFFAASEFVFEMHFKVSSKDRECPPNGEEKEESARHDVTQKAAHLKSIKFVRQVSKFNDRKTKSNIYF